MNLETQGLTADQIRGIMAVIIPLYLIVAARNAVIARKKH